VRITIVIISITHSQCMSVALVIQHEKRTRHIAICDLPSYIIFFLQYLKTARFSWKKVQTIKCVFLFSL